MYCLISSSSTLLNSVRLIFPGQTKKKKKTYFVNEGDNFKLFESGEHALQFYSYLIIDHIQLPSINSGSYIVL